MKKKIVVLLVLCIMMLSGCNKTLECSKKIEDNNLKSSINLNMNFKGKKVSNVNINYEIKLNDEYKIISSLIKETYLAKFKKYKSDGVNVSVEEKEDKIISKLDFDISKMKNIKSDSVYLIDPTTDYKKIKSSLEKEGYTCK